jgi:glutathione S-transferase
VESIAWNLCNHTDTIMTTHTITLHGTHLSGHVHRVELLLSMLNLPYQFVEAGADVRASAAFRQLNALGQIPVLQDGDLILCDSNAILVYLCKRYAPGSAWLPEDAEGAAAVQRWLSIAAGEIMYGPALARAIAQWQAPGEAARAALIAQRVLGFIESHLAGRRFLAADHATLADLACYGYLAHAPEGGNGLDAYPALRSWLKRVEALPAFVAMPDLPLP